MTWGEALCDRCGGYLKWEDCWNCDDGYSHHDCGEDCCMCLYPDEPNIVCEICHGRGGYWVCVNPSPVCIAVGAEKKFRHPLHAPVHGGYPG